MTEPTDDFIEVAIIRTKRDGTRSATILHNRPPFLPAVGFLYRYLRESRRKDAPPHFRFGVLEENEVTAVLAMSEQNADKYDEAMAAMVDRLTS